MTLARRALFAVALAVGLPSCGASAADHEIRGDRAYGDGNYDEALAEYRLALRQHAPNGRLRAKAGAAALRLHDLPAGTEEYLALAGEDEERVEEAADGLVRVARLALDENDRAGLRLALDGLQQLGAQRAFGGFARQLAIALGDAPQSSDAMAVLPLAAAAAPDARAQDSLMFEDGKALERAGRCVAATAVYESLVRRRRLPAIADDAAGRAASCSVQLGRRALEGNRPTEAEGWFERAVAQAGGGPLGRAAYVGMGDVLFARGDYRAAVAAYERAMAGASVGDSIAATARRRLNAIADAGTVNQ